MVVCSERCALNIRKLLPLLLIAFFISPNASAQDEMADIYELGDQSFSINAGLILPLFILGIDGTVTPGYEKLTLGASGSLHWGAFVNNELTVGVDLGGMFTLSKLDRTLIMVPISGIVTYALRFYPFEVLLHAALGVNFTKLDNDLYIGPILKPGASFFWNYSNEWSFGLQTEYWFAPEIYFGDTPPVSHSTFGNFLGITLAILYHFQ